MVKKSKQWISVYRSLMEQPYYCKLDYVGLWVHLLLEASYTDRDILFKNQKINLKRGELVLSFFNISNKFKRAFSQIKKMIDYFVRLKQIRILKTKKGRNGYCILKILNYNKYQKNLNDSLNNSINDSFNIAEVNDLTDSSDNKNNIIDSLSNSFDDSLSNFNDSLNDSFNITEVNDLTNSYVNKNSINDSLSDCSTPKNLLNFTPENAKSEKAHNIIYRNKDFSNKGANKNNNKEEFYFSSPLLKNQILNIFKEEYNNSRGMDYIVLNEQKELSAIQGLLTAYISQNGNSQYSEEKITNDFRMFFQNCLKIQNKFYKTNLSLSLIVNKFNEITQVIKNEVVQEDPQEKLRKEMEFIKSLTLHDD